MVRACSPRAYNFNGNSAGLKEAPALHQSIHGQVVGRLLLPTFHVMGHVALVTHDAAELHPFRENFAR
jgi:hypothetical protein